VDEQEWQQMKIEYCFNLASATDTNREIIKLYLEFPTQKTKHDNDADRSQQQYTNHAYSMYLLNRKKHQIKPSFHST